MVNSISSGVFVAFSVKGILIEHCLGKLNYSIDAWINFANE
jgi:hypothetical protein